MANLSVEHQRDLLEVLEDRYGARSTIITSQLPVEKWHASIAGPTFADAILDRLVHNAYRVKLKGAKAAQPDHPAAQCTPASLRSATVIGLTGLGEGL